MKKSTDVFWQVSSPEYQREKLNNEVLELADLLDIDPENMGDLLSAYIVAEDLALRQIQQEVKIPMMRHVSIGETSFDGILVKDNLITCIEVTFLVQPDIRQAKIDFILQKTGAVKTWLQKQEIEAKLKLLMVLVTQFEKIDEKQLHSSLVTKCRTTPVHIDIQFLDFESLQKTYAMD